MVYTSATSLTPCLMISYRLPVRTGADVRAAADAAAEAMAGRFASSRQAALAKALAGPDTPTQSREPTPRDESAARDDDAQPIVRSTTAAAVIFSNFRVLSRTHCAPEHLLSGV